MLLRVSEPFTVIPKHDQVVVDNLGNRLRIELDNALTSTLVVEDSSFLLDWVETEFTYDNKVFDIDPVKDTSLVGYFQTERYFKHIEDKVREEFQFKDSIVDDCKDIIETFFDNPIWLTHP